MKLRTALALFAVVVLVACGGPIASMLPSGLPSNLPTLPATSEPPASAEATPTEKPSKEPTGEPSAEPTATAEPSPTDGQPTGTPVPTSSATPVPTATPQLTWTEPLLAADGRFAEPDLLLDALGNAHVAVAGLGAGNRGIWYSTNASGSWTTEQVSTPPESGGDENLEYDGEPSITLDDDGSVWIAFTRWVCWECAPNPSVGIFVVNNSSGDWSDAVQVAGEQTNSPSLVMKNGVKHFAFAEGMVPGLRNYPVWYATGTGQLGDLTIERVTRDGGSPNLDMQGGITRIVFSGERVTFATELEDGSFDLQDILGSNDGFGAVLAVERSSGDEVVAWSNYDSAFEHLSTFFAPRVAGSWAGSALAIEDVELADLAIGPSGVVQFIGSGSAEAAFDSLIYATNSSSSASVAETIADQGGGESAMAVDDLGRPHVIYAVDADGENPGVFYLVGPAQ